MLKLLGCMLVLGGSVGYQLLHAGRSRTELEILAEMKMVLDRMEREVRINRISLPRLLNRLATMCRTEAAGLLDIYSLPNRGSL